MKEYDLRILIQRAYDNIPCNSDSERAAVMAKIFGVEGKVDLSGNGAYRKADIVSLIESAVENKDLAKIPTENLEKIVSHDPGKLDITYELAKDVGKFIGKIPRYIFYGALPAKSQIKNAEKYGENPLHYTIANIIAEAAMNTGLTAYLASNFEFEDNTWGPIMSLIGLYSGANFLIRLLSEDSIGSLPGAIVYYSIIKPINFVMDKYKTKKKEIMEKAKTHAFPYNHLKILGFDGIKPYKPEIQTEETKQLPSPERKAIVNTELVEHLLERKAKK